MKRKLDKPMRTDQETVFITGYDALEEAIQEYFSLPDYDIISSEFLNNGETREYLVYNRPMTNEEIDQMNNGLVSFAAGKMMCDMCSRGALQAGRYYVEVNW